MSRKIIAVIACLVLAAACSKPDATDTAPGAVPSAPETPAVPYASPQQEGAPPEAPPVVTEAPPVDLGDVDSGIFLRGLLAPEAASATCTAEYVETMRGNLSLTTITVKEPFPEQLPIRFEFSAKRDFPDTPVVIRARAYRGENEPMGEEYACVLGSNARGLPAAEGAEPLQYAFTVNVLEGLETIPDTMLVFGRADAWLMPKGTVETLLDPKTADSPHTVALMGNPVRINFVRAAAAQ